ncbi:uncharacterized protein BKA55DRAFT_582984 [Fusarium redolens]|uniref:Uncharacterized protein n=1 Tax=Fusarium redolens TaxID=48865 RepID=A0A9P9G3E4_FUSRE|nr:uncharacterized protein BKA55DRAFT_582984 [Fusarium redolens]KAH7230512.1 hypothetical protein BKA55DRAFT_582984 [Fusarium redolens]
MNCCSLKLNAASAPQHASASLMLAAQKEMARLLKWTLRHLADWRRCGEIPVQH